MVGMDIPDEAVEAAAPWITSFLERRGLVLRGKEAEVLAGYVLNAAAPLLMAKAWEEGEVAGQDNRDSNRGYNIEHKYNPYRSQP